MDSLNPPVASFFFRICPVYINFSFSVIDRKRLCSLDTSMAPIMICAVYSHESLLIYDCNVSDSSWHVSTTHSLRKSNWFTVYWFPCWFVLSLGNCIATVWACQISIVTLFKRKSKKLSDTLTFLLCFSCCCYSSTQNIKQNYLRWKPYSAF